MNTLPTENPAPEGVLQKSIRAGKWLTIDYIVQKAVAILPFFILARILSPGQFGIASIILLVPRFLQTTSEHGLATAAIQKGGNVEKYLNAIWTVNVLRGILISILIFITGPVIAQFYHLESYTWLIRLGGIFILIRQCTNIGEIWFTKDLDFKKIFIRNTARAIVYAVVTIIAAYTIRSYLALVIGNLALYLTEMIASYVLHPYRPKLSFKFGVLKELTAYSKWAMGQVLGDQAYGFMESSIIARTTNISVVGLYSKAKNLASIGPGFISSIISMIALPAFARIKDAPEKIVDGLKKSLDLLFVVTLPIILFIQVAGGKLILVVLGTPWLPITFALRVLLIYFTVSYMTDICLKLLSGIGYPDKKVKLDAIKIILSLILLLYLTPRYGINGAALAIFLGFIPTFFFTLYYLKSLTRITYWNILIRICFPLFLAGGLMAPLAIFKDTLMQQSLTVLIILTVLYFLIYSAVIYIVGKKFHRGPYMTIQLILKTLPRL